MSATLIAGRYVLGALLGSGGTADVFEAEDLESRRTVAVKVLHAGLSAGTARWDAFFEEVRAARAVDHPGIPTIEDWGVDPGEPPRAWIAMERVLGTTLSAEVRERGALDPVSALAVTDALLAVLAAAHAQHVVHRDVTPSNVMFDPNPGSAESVAASVRLLDFGLADIPGRSTAGADVLLSGVASDLDGVIASVPFASPEHLRGEAVTEASDVYQLGATLFFALTGSMPFTGESSAQRLGHLGEQPPSLADRGVVGLPGVDAVIQRAMRKDPTRRFPSVAVMRDTLRAAAADGVRGGIALPAIATAVSASEYRTRVLPAALPASVSTPFPSPAPIPVRQAAPPPPPSPRRARRIPAWGAAVAGAAAITAIIAVAATATPTAPGVGAPTETVTPTFTATATPTPTETAAELLAVPALSGLSLGEATALLESTRLRRGSITEVDGADAAGTVLGTDPASGTRVVRGTVVAVRIASGRNAVPQTVGMTVADAGAALRAAGFDSKVIGNADDIVASTMPAAGEVLAHGAFVTISTPIRTAPTATPRSTPTIQPSPTATASPRPTGDAP